MDSICRVVRSMIRISPSCLKTIRLPSGANLGSSSRVPSFLGEVAGFRPAVHLPEVDIPRIAAMLASRNSHEDDLFAVRGEIAVDGVVDLPAFAEASEPLRPEVVEIEAAVPRIVIRVAVEQDSAIEASRPGWADSRICRDCRASRRRMRIGLRVVWNAGPEGPSPKSPGPVGDRGGRPPRPPFGSRLVRPWMR